MGERGPNAAAQAAGLVNPSLGNVTTADVVRLRAARDIMAQIIPVWLADPRYSGLAQEAQATMNSLDNFATQVEAYLAVQGT